MMVTKKELFSSTTQLFYWSSKHVDHKSYFSTAQLCFSFNSESCSFIQFAKRSPNLWDKQRRSGLGCFGKKVYSRGWVVHLCVWFYFSLALLWDRRPTESVSGRKSERESGKLLLALSQHGDFPLFSFLSKMSKCESMSQVTMLLLLLSSHLTIKGQVTKVYKLQ